MGGPTIGGQHSEQAEPCAAETYSFHKFSRFSEKKMANERVEKNKRGPYSSKGVSADTKRVLAQYAHGAKKHGVSFKQFLSFGENAEFKPSLRTLQDQVKKIESGDPIFTEEKQSGRRALLNEYQLSVLGGWVLSQNSVVRLDDVKRYVAITFGVLLSKSTACRYMSELQLTEQMTSSRPPRNMVGRDEYNLGYFEFIKECHDEDFFSVHPVDLGAADFFTNSRRLERSKGYNAKRSPQKKVVRAPVKYTDCYLVCLWYQDENWTPSLMFTHNPTFDPAGPRAQEVFRWCQELGVARDRIYYTKSDKTYCKEVADQVVTFCRRYEDTLRNTHILHDGGNSFLRQGEKIFENYGSKVRVVPPLQHGEMSPCDNKFNAVVKERWRAIRDDSDDEAYNALLLLHLTDQVQSRSIASFFERNLLLKGGPPTLTRTILFTEGSQNRSEWKNSMYESYVDTFIAFEQEREGAAQPPPRKRNRRRFK